MHFEKKPGYNSGVSWNDVSWRTSIKDNYTEMDADRLIFVAAENGDALQLSKALERGADPNATNPHYYEYAGLHYVIIGSLPASLAHCLAH